MKSKAIFLETTVIPATRSISEITSMLAEAGATGVHQQYLGGRIVGLSFSIATSQGECVFKIPARTAAVLKTLKAQLGPRSRKSEDELTVQSERIAWRQLAVWCKAQLAIIDLGMVQTSEVFMPYMLGPKGQTMWEDFSKVKQIGAG